MKHPLEKLLKEMEADIKKLEKELLKYRQSGAR